MTPNLEEILKRHLEPLLLLHDDCYCDDPEDPIIDSRHRCAHCNLLELRCEFEKLIAERDAAQHLIAECESILNPGPIERGDDLKQMVTSANQQIETWSEWNAELTEKLAAAEQRAAKAFEDGARAQRLEDSERAKNFDGWFELKEPRGVSVSEEILAAPLASVSTSRVK